MAVTPDLLRRLMRLGPEPVPGGAPTVLWPEGDAPCPAILYCHAHGGNYAIGREELTQGTPGTAGIPAPDLLAQGFAVTSIDLPGFGARQGEGTEAALAKAALWQGKTLGGRMIGELLAVADGLLAHPRVTALATWGLSMGGAHAYLLAALEPRIAAVVQHGMMADIAPMIASGAHVVHGDYLTIPGLLEHGDMGDIAALVAPRPQFVGLRSGDRITPPDARDGALARLRAAYGDGPLEIHIAEAAGHGETPDHRARALDFLTRHLKDTT